MKASEFFVRRHFPKPGICFVLMPFEEALTAVYEHGIKPQVEAMHMQCKRADEIYSAQNILGDIWDSIQTAELIIADLTGKNPNVLYELGLCHSLWKRVILIAQNREDVPFDLRAWRVIWYDFSFPGAARLKEELARAIESLREENNIESQLVPLSTVADTQPEPTEQESKWMHGIIEAWKPDKRFGFIKSGDESFWFSPDYLFALSMVPTEGASVAFIPLPPLARAKSRRASSIFITGTKLRGEVNRILKGKGYAFATVHSQIGETQSLFLEVADVPDLVLGTVVEFIIDQNRAGPTGTHLQIVQNAAKTL